MFDINVIAGLSVLIGTSIFILWFFGKLTKEVSTRGQTPS